MNKNKTYINGLHPAFQDIVRAFLDQCFESGIQLEIYSGFRTILEQDKLYRAYLSNKTKFYPAAPPGQSYHNYGLAIDVKVVNSSDPRDLTLLKKAGLIARNLGMEWGGNFSASKFGGFKERHHFQFSGGFDWSELKKLKENGTIDQNGFVDLSKGDKNANSSKTEIVITDTIGSEVGASIIETKEKQKSTVVTKEEAVPKTNKISEVEASGIWQIIKTIVDKEVAKKEVNDATIAFNQGSLFNFVQKICQKPFVEFFGDTYGDQYYFITRKPPFTRDSFNSLYTVDVIEEDVYGDDLGWNNEAYSWYQIIPRNSFLNYENQIFLNIPAFFFEEYAKIWGSKPLAIVTNYISFSNLNADNGTAEQQAIDDLKFIIQINSYLPFTRKGTITIKQDRRIKRGMRIYYTPTNEYYYVDSVTHSYIKTDVGVDAITTLGVSRGMIKDYVTPELLDKDTLSYFNLIDFGNFDEKNKNDVTKDLSLKIHLEFYFEADSPNLLFPSNVERDTIVRQASNDYKDKTGVLDLNYPNFRREHATNNQANVKKIVKELFSNKGMKIELNGFIDFDTNLNSSLPRQRANNLKSYIISVYNNTYDPDPTINNRILVSNKTRSITDGDTLTRALNRRVELNNLPFKAKARDDNSKSSRGWKVNFEIFQFFIKRKQVFLT